MTQLVSNPSADSAEKIERAAKILRVSKHAKAVFESVYRGHKSHKSIDDIRREVPKFNTNTYVAADRLYAEDILDKKGLKGKIFYFKVPFYTRNRDHILRLSENKKRLESYPTKRKVSAISGRAVFTFLTKPRTKQITVDDIDSFQKLRNSHNGNLATIKKMSERKINRGICKILHQQDKKDWGGERNDIFTTRVVIEGKRITSSFALKGKGTVGPLTPKKMGKNGDQIPRLFQGTAEAFFVVYNDTVKEVVFDLMQTHAIQKSIETGKMIYYSIIDGGDLARLACAYPQAFN